MRRAWPWLALGAAALIFGLAAGSGGAEDSPIPSIHNPGPRGAKVLSTWLGGARALDSAQIPAGTEVLVFADAASRFLMPEDIAALKAFVEAGGTLFYLTPRPARAQGPMAQWLGLDDGPALPSAKDSFGDADGAAVPVAGTHPFLSGVGALRVSADTTVTVDDGEPLAGTTLWRKPIGRGEVLIAAGSDLIENRRLDLAGNAQLWANVAQRQVVFDEHHLGPAPSPPLTVNLWAMLAQLVVLGLLFIAARAPRLGPARPELRREHRSTLEYVRSIAGLMERAGVDDELKAALRIRLRRLMHERLGIPVTLSAEDASLALAAHTGLPPRAFADLDAGLSGARFAEAAAGAARLEDAIVGRRAA